MVDLLDNDLTFKQLQQFLVQNRQWNNCGERILMAWNTGDPPLHGGILPPFVYGKGLHNEWLVNEVLSSDFRFVIDATLAASSFYLESLDPQFNKLLPNSGSELNKTWEYGGNHHLASLYGSLYFCPNNTLSVRLVKCSGIYHLLNLARNTFYSLNGFPENALHGLKYVPGQEQQLWLSTRFLQSRRKKKRINCMEAVRSLDKKSTCTDWYKVSFQKSMPLRLSLSLKSSLKSLLQITADEDKSVVLAVAGDNYRDMLMHWVCRLRHLAVKNFIVCALDSEIYQFSVLQV